MNKVLLLNLFVAVQVLLFSCEHEVFLTGATAEEFPMYVAADVDIPITGEQFEILHQTNAAGNFFENLGAIGTLSDGALGTTLHLGLFTTANLNQFDGHNPVFTLQFWPDNLEPGRDAETQELRSFFTENTSFPFGEGPGKVNLSLALNPPGDREGLSRSAYVNVRQGAVDIERVFTHVSNIPTIPTEEQTFDLVLINFTGQIGIFSFLEFQQALLDGVPYLAKDIAEVKGSAALVLKATWR